MARAEAPGGRRAWFASELDPGSLAHAGRTYARRVRAVTIALVLLVLACSSAAGGDGGIRIAFYRGADLIELNLATGLQKVELAHAPIEELAWSGDGALLSDGGRIVGGPALPTNSLAWAPSGETAAYRTKSGAIALWSSGSDSHTILPASWGADSFAWGADGELAVGRGPRGHHDVWLWNAGKLTRVAVARDQYSRAIVAGVDGAGRALWWDDPYSSASIAADGIALYANGERLADTLVFPDYVSVCGRHLALAAGPDRYTTHGKRVLFDGRDVSSDPTRSWVSPSCNASGFLVAAAGRNWVERRVGRGELRSIWELAPRKVRLSYPPAGWTDESPRVLPDGSILFARTRETSVKVPNGWRTTDQAHLELIAYGHTTWVGSTSWSVEGSAGPSIDYYGHYAWPWLIATTQ